MHLGLFQPVTGEKLLNPGGRVVWKIVRAHKPGHTVPYGDAYRWEAFRLATELSAISSLGSEGFHVIIRHLGARMFDDQFETAFGSRRLIFFIWRSDTEEAPKKAIAYPYQKSGHVHNGQKKV